MAEEKTTAQHGKSRMEIVKEDESGIRLDRWFKRHYPAFSHGQLQKFLRTGQIRVEGKRVESSDRLEAGQAIRIPPQFAPLQKGGGEKKGGRKNAMPQAEWLRDCVLFEDDDVIALNKPAGLAVQGGTGLKRNLDDLLIIFARDGVTKPKLVHRLDRETSGVLLIARNDFAAARLAASFRERETEKIYWALTMGIPKPKEGRIDAPLVRRGEKTIVTAPADPDSKTASTLYRVVESAKKKIAFVVLWPLTGRTHQLRVHMAHLGTPILGDRLYGNEIDPTLCADEMGDGLHLHARRLVIPHPRRGVIDVTAPLGPEMQKTWDCFQFDSKAETLFEKSKS